MELLRLICSFLAGCVFGFGIGYIIGSDNGFVKGCEWAKGKVFPEKIKKMYAIPKDRILKDFEVDYVFLTKHPILKNSWKSEVLYEGRDYEGGNED